MSPTELAPERIRKGERTRTRILDAAADVLARKGYAAATLTEIASVAKMQAGSLYYHFDSKDAIVEEVLAVGLEHARDAIRAALNAAGDDASGHDRLMAAVVAYVTAIHLIRTSLKQIFVVSRNLLKPQEKTSQFHCANSRTAGYALSKQDNETAHSEAASKLV